MKAGVEIYIDLNKYIDDFAIQITNAVAHSIVTDARNLVRKDIGELKNSINVETVTHTSKNVFANAPHATAQEYGLAPYGKLNYGFTPYMRPAAKNVISQLGNIVKAQSDEALNRSKV